MSIEVPLLSGYLTAATAAAELHVHPRTLKRWKNLHYGPPFITIGKRVFYRHADIAAWLATLGTISPATKRSRERRLQGTLLNPETVTQGARR